MPQTSERTGRFTESVIRHMTRVSERFGAINLSQGFPDFDPPAELTAALEKAAREGPHQYEITYGATAFRQALCDKQGRALGRPVDPETEVVVTCGATEAMVCTMLAVVNPGDKVGIFSPFYENYGADAIIAGAESVFIPLVPPAWDVDWAALEAAFQAGIRALVVCNPSNPCGKVFTREELTRIGDLARRHNAWVITDEVYEHIVYPPMGHVRMASLPGMWDHTLTVGSLSKTYSITGWRLGWMVGPAFAVEAARKVHDFLTVGAAAPLQAAALPGLRAGDEYYRGLQELYGEKRALFHEGLLEAGIPHGVPQGAYYVLCDVGPFLSLPRFAGFSDLKFCEWMAEHVGVAAVPGSSFFPQEGSTLIRLHFARSEASLREALGRLKKMGDM
ncbi:MAG TPA: aminotransferase class I/II-fold pyridoxal phosphate-dependent enzyme [Candidatus Limnocylindria bacterium]|nr:aminotransferase class I/II-fold pyridoxal phosphate-dependent enzyme [Candidatus Limnocylindria bacterium]